MQPSYNPDGSVAHHIEKGNPSAAWVFVPIKSSMRDYYKIVASVVAADLHKKIDEHSLVPLTKFLIRKNTDNNHGYQLHGSVYKKISSTTPIRKTMSKRDFKDHTNAVYIDSNVEHNIGMWDYLGLPIFPEPAFLELSEDNELVRYDYYNAFQFSSSKIYENCFCTSDFQISDYKCDIEGIKTFKQKLYSENRGTLERVVSKIREESREYLEREDLFEVNQALDGIINSEFLEY